MVVIRGIENLKEKYRHVVLTIGNFDGVHFGHRQILRRVARLAGARGWKASVLTFDPHPTRIVAPERTPRLLTSPGRRAELMAGRISSRC